MSAHDQALTAPTGGGGSVRAFFAKPRNRVVVLTLLFAASWTTALVKMAEATGTEGLAVGVPLAAAPVPIVVGVFWLLSRARPQPWPHLAFALSWGAGAGAMAALYANSWSIEAITNRSGMYNGRLLGLTVVAPFVEEAAKGAAVLLLLLFRRHWFRGPLDGLVLAGTTAAGFAFTENVLYFGRAFGEGNQDGDAAAQTASIFLGRAILTPFAHPLFTSATGLAIGLAVLMRNRFAAVATGFGGYLVAVGLHSAWNGAAWKTTVDETPAYILLVYFALMAPLLLTVFVVGARLRRKQLDAVLYQLPWYVSAGWLTWNEPLVLGSVSDRGRQRRAALALFGKPGAKALGEYQWNATALAELRDRAVRGHVPPTYAQQERALLDRMWALRPWLEPVLVGTMPVPKWMPAYAWGQPPGWGSPSWPQQPGGVHPGFGQPAMVPGQQYAWPQQAVGAPVPHAWPQPAPAMRVPPQQPTTPGWGPPQYAAEVPWPGAAQPAAPVVHALPAGPPLGAAGWDVPGALAGPASADAPAHESGQVDANNDAPGYAPWPPRGAASRVGTHDPQRPPA
jgi:RsiW-degrading membrane proteinase PrsW (M82 family)